MKLQIEKGLKLRHFRKEDLEAYFDCFQSNLGKDGFLRYFTKAEQLEKEVEHIVKQYSLEKPSEETFVIEFNGEFIGFVDLEGLNSKTELHKINLGFGVRSKFSGKGIVTKAVKKICEYAFKRYKLKRIEAYCRIDNKASARLLEKAGFELEGKLRNNVFQNNKIYDELVWSKIN